MSTVFINGKPTVINDLRRLKNPPFWQAIFLVVLFGKIPLFCKDLIISFISLFVRVIPHSNFYLIFLPMISYKWWFFSIFWFFLESIILNSFEFSSSTLNGKLTKLAKPVIIPVASAKNPPDCII